MAPHKNSPSSMASCFTPPGFSKIAMTPSVGFRIDTITPPDETASSLDSSFNSDSGFHGRRPLPAGVYVPTPCFFDEATEDVDTAAITRHAVRLAQAGVAGLATQGSNGEAVHLTHEERQLVTQTTRKALDDAGFSHMPLVVGCGAQSTRETMQLCCEAWESGGDYALVLPPSYYATLFAPSSSTVVDFFRCVADASPIPLIIYNYPGGAGGLDLSSDTIIELGRHANIVGVKLTCGNTGKLGRVASAMGTAIKPGTDASVPGFLVLGGSADFTTPSLTAGGHGILAGLANLAPKACVSIVDLWRQGRHAEAQVLQDTVARGDWVAIQAGVVGVKGGLQAWMGYGGYARSPLPKPTAEQAKRLKDGFRELMMLEKTL